MSSILTYLDRRYCVPASPGSFVRLRDIPFSF